MVGECYMRRDREREGEREEVLFWSERKSCGKNSNKLHPKEEIYVIPSNKTRQKWKWIDVFVKTFPPFLRLKQIQTKRQRFSLGNEEKVLYWENIEHASYLWQCKKKQITFSPKRILKIQFIFIILLHFRILRVWSKWKLVYNFTVAIKTTSFQATVFRVVRLMQFLLIFCDLL